MTMPIGIALAFLVDWSNKKRTIITILAAVSIEFLQLLSIVALHRIDRIFDIKDLILNTAGGILADFKSFRRLYRGENQSEWSGAINSSVRRYHKAANFSANSR